LKNFQAVQKQDGRGIATQPTLELGTTTRCLVLPWGTMEEKKNEGLTSNEKNPQGRPQGLQKPWVAAKPLAGTLKGTCPNKKKGGKVNRGKR